MVKRPTSTTQPSGARRKGRPIRQRKDRRWIWAAAVLGIVLLVAFIVTLRMTRESGDIDGVATFSNLLQGHQEGPLTYPQTPPVGGIHNPAWQNCGIYDQPILNENGVHSLEHGAAWITYRPDLSATDVEQLRTLTRGRRYALLSPYPGLPAPVVASAWGVQLKAAGASDPRLAQFIAKYSQGLQAPEPGATCTGGVGTPGSR